MFGSVVLDVAIGMALVYLLFSVICAAVNELIEHFLKNRAADLERGIQELLNHRPGEKAVQALYDHPLIDSLFAGSFQSAAQKKWWQGTKLPSYIPARSFALAIMDIALPGGPGTLSGTAGSTPAAPWLPAPGVPVTAPHSLDQLRNGIAQNATLNDNTKRALVALVDAAGNNVSQARDNIETWFNNSMDRVSGWYKRRTQIIIFVMALVAAVVVNVDSIHILKSLSNDKALRDSLVSSAQEYAKKGGAVDSSQGATPAGRSSCADEDYNCKMAKSYGQLKALGIPLGWVSDPIPQEDVEGKFGWLILKLAGWLATAFAVSLGAPFWFDILNKLVVVRSTVKPHEKSPEEPSKQ